MQSLKVIQILAIITFAFHANADVAAPVSIKLPPDRPQAVTGQEYVGEFLVQVHKPGTITDISIFGDGWTVTAFSPPSTPMQAQPGLVRIPFRAVPSNADAAIGLRLNFNGQAAEHGYHVGPAASAKKGKHGSLARVANTPGARTPKPGTAPQTPVNPGSGQTGTGGGSSGPRPRGGTVVVEGRIVYDRIGLDRSNPPDGDTSDLEDIPPLQIGADGISYAILDNDPTDFEVMWEGVTDEFGRFVTPPLDADVDGDGSGPDLILTVAALRTDSCGVFSEDADWYYIWDSEEIEDFEGDHYNFGIRTPADPAEHPAIHIYNSLIRTRRFIIERHGFETRFVSAHWPVDHWSEYHPDDEEIHIHLDRAWQENTPIHEYGHHFIAGLYEPAQPEYCNGFCDGNVLCTFDAGCPKPGHCTGCPENDHDAWNEGWPDWLADVVPRSFGTRYTYDTAGAPYEALFPYNFESPGVCCIDGLSYDPTITEAFAAALLRDIDDVTQDDHNNDEIRDIACLGPEEILNVVINDQPRNVLQFIAAFSARYPQHTSELWSTAFNVGGAAYVAGFPVDTQPPGIASNPSSQSHPLGVGGPLPCIDIEFTPAPDDATGASTYSLIATHTPAGQMPSTTPWPLIDSVGNCKLRATVVTNTPGTYYVSLRARDGAGNWSPQYVTFGPFVVTDCNGSGFLDICDVRCCADDCLAGEPGACQFNGGFCLSGSCGTSSDCNHNYIPDECDIADGRSDDCNQNGVPDDCETGTLKHWTGNDSLHPTWWEVAGNWAEGVPATGNDVCVASGEPSPLVRRDPWTIGILACNESISIAQASGFPIPTLTLQRPSFILGGVTMPSGVLQVNDSLRVDGTFTFGPNGTLRGTGQTTVNGAFAITGSPHTQDQTLNLRCNTNASGGIQGTNSTIRNFAGYTYTHDGSSVTVVDGNGTDQFINEGTFVKSAGAGTLRFGLPVVNSGLIRCESGTLQLRNMTCTGSVIGLPGTTLEFASSGAVNFEPGSSLTGDHIYARASGTTVNIRGTYDAGIGTTVGGSGQSPTMNFLAGANIVDYGNDLQVLGGNAHFECVHGAPIVFQNMNIRGAAYFDSGDPIFTNTIALRGTIRGASQQLTVNGLFTWEIAGDFINPGVVNANGGLLLQPSSSVRNMPRVLNNAATAIVQGPLEILTGGGINNLTTGVWDIQVDGNLLTGSSLFFNNSGTLVKSAGAGTAAIGTGTPTLRPTITNTGTLEVRSGTLAFSWGSFTQTAGQILLNGGNLSMTGSPAMPLALNGGGLRGSGTVSAVVNNTSATVEPGLSTGTLNITGAYNQSPTGVLKIEIGGTSSGQFDVVNVSGAATLAGELNVQLVGGFTPAPGNTIVIVNSASRSGTFSTLTGAPGFQVSYTPTQVILTATAPQLPGDLDGDCDVDIQDLATLLANYGTLSGATHAMGDIDGDGDVDLSDLAALLAGFGTTC